MIKKLLQAILTLVKAVWPKSRWGNLVYLIVGFVLSYWDVLQKLFEEIGKLFS